MTKPEFLHVILASALALPTFAATTITFQYPGAISTGASAINNNGDVVGSYMDAAHVYHGFRRTSGGVFTSFDVPGAESISPKGISDGGVIAGIWSDAGDIQHGFIVSANGMVETFDPPESFGLRSVAINSLGVIAGGYLTGDQPLTLRGYIRATDGTFTVFDPPRRTQFLSITAVNAAGGIVGTLAPSVLFLRSSDGVFHTKLSGTSGPAHDTQTYPYGVNSLGVVVGTRKETYGIPQADTIGISFTWDGNSTNPATSVTTFLRERGDSTTAISINDSGVVIGNVRSSTSGTVSAFVRSSDGTITPFTVGSVSTIAAAINNSEVICGSTITSSDPNYIGFLFMP